jgi:hypothetical protein
MLLFPPWGCQDDYEAGFLTENKRAAPIEGGAALWLVKRPDCYGLRRVVLLPFVSASLLAAIPFTVSSR